MAAIQILQHVNRSIAEHVARARSRMAGRGVLRLLAILVTGLLAAGLFAAALTAQAQAVARNGELVADGAWCWFQDPRAVHFVGARDRTYIGYVTSAGDVDVVSQDAGTALLIHTTLHPRLQADDHAAPGLVILPDRRIGVFYSPHTGSAMYYRISLHSEDITGFGPELTVSTNTGSLVGYTYANPIYLPAEHRLYLFFRGGNSLPAMTWTTDYLHWAKSVTVVVPNHTPAFTRPYVKYATNGLDTIGIAFTDGHPDELSNAGRPNSVYEMKLKGGVLRTPDGAPVTVPDTTIVSGAAAPHTGPAHTDWLRANPASGGLVYQDRGTAPAWLEATAFDPQASPVIVYSTYQNDANGQYRYAKWNGTSWADAPIVGAGGTISPDDPQYSGGADIARTDVGTVYLSRETSTGSKDWEIERWHTATAGASWSHTAITQASPVKNIRPVAPWGPPGEISVLWMSGRYTDWAAGYSTQLREWTTGRAPTTARISASAHSIRVGSTVQISGRIVQGYLGSPVLYALVELIGHTAGQPDRLLQRANANSVGLVTFTRRPSASMRFIVRMAATSTWGGSTSPSIVVVVS